MTSLLTLLAACGGTSGDGGSDRSVTAGRCVVELHGKGARGRSAATRDGRTIVAPDGNAEGWGGRQWLYADDTSYAAALRLVGSAVDGEACTAVVVHGFSNGGAFAGTLYCRGETLGGRLRGVIVDDPVPDAGVTPCAPTAGARIALYWTGALSGTAAPGWNCAEQDWTCAGGVTIGIDAYAAALGTPVLDSPHDDHRMFEGAPQRADWLA